MNTTSGNFRLTVLLLAGFMLSSFVQKGLDPIAGYIGAGNAHGLATYFDEIVQLTIDGREGTYSKVQAERIMKDFFRQYPSKSFTIEHASEADEVIMQYAIGTYSSGSKEFRTYIYLNKKGERMLIRELSFEYE